MTEFVDRNDAGNIDFAERIAPIEAAPPGPESFDATAALRRVMAVADDLDAISDAHWTAYKHGDVSDTRRGSAYTEGFCTGYDSAAQRIRAAVLGDDR